MARYYHSLDSKGRVIIPARVRSHLGGKIYLCPSLDDGYLSGYSEEKFKDILEQLNAYSSTDQTMRTFRRVWLTLSNMYEPDAQGRINVSDDLLALVDAKPGDELCVIDMFDKIEICSAKAQRALDAKLPKLSELKMEAYDVKGL